MFNNCFIQSGVLGGREINAGKVDFPQVTVETLNIALSLLSRLVVSITLARELYFARGC